MTGDGGDELFGGYDTFRAQEMWRIWNRLPRWMRASTIEPMVDALRPTRIKKGIVNKAKRFIAGARHDPELGHARWRLFCDEPMLAGLLSQEALHSVRQPIDEHILGWRRVADRMKERDRACFIDFSSYLVDNCLVKVDRMSMACSIEARVPFLDRNVIETAFRMPPELKYDARHSKILLKQVAERHVPKACVRRPKEGFSIPMKNWLGNEFSDLMDHFFEPDRLERQGLLQAQAVQRLRGEHTANRENHSHLLWSLLVFQDWLDRWRVSV